MVAVPADLVLQLGTADLMRCRIQASWDHPWSHRMYTPASAQTPETGEQGCCCYICVVAAAVVCAAVAADTCV